MQAAFLYVVVFTAYHSEFASSSAVSNTSCVLIYGSALFQKDKLLLPKNTVCMKSIGFTGFPWGVPYYGFLGSLYYKLWPGIKKYVEFICMYIFLNTNLEWQKQIETDKENNK